MEKASRKYQWWIPTSGKVQLFIVAVLTGILFTSTAALFRGNESERPQDLSDLIRSESARLDVLEAEVADLRRQRDELLAESEVDMPRPSEDMLIAAAGMEIKGPGLRVRMWDAPAPLEEDSPFTANDLVIHQQDVEAVLNALWAGGADGVTVMGQRLTATSAVRCIGNVLLLHGQQYSPPYVIEAIGDPIKLRNALDESPAIAVYLQYVEAVGVGWEVTELNDVTLPAYAGPTQLTHAKEITS